MTGTASRPGLGLWLDLGWGKGAAWVLSACKAALPAPGLCALASLTDPASPQYPLPGDLFLKLEGQHQAMRMAEIRDPARGVQGPAAPSPCGWLDRWRGNPRWFPEVFRHLRSPI